MDEQTAVAELRRCAGGQFDPAVVTHFCDVLASRQTVELRAA
jgi:HD-GYP domain-containing protein (c-di-GMP phosphodiesterase class II)